jgi:hypothetical protein
LRSSGSLTLANPAGAVGEVNAANDVEVADGKLLAEGAKDSIVER